MKILFRTWLVFILVTSILLPNTLYAQANEIIFKDVPASHWAYQSIRWASSTGMVKGFKDNTFRPSNKVNQAEFLAMMVNATLPNLPAGTGSWEQKYFDTAGDKLWLTQPNHFSPLTRGAAAQLLANMAGYQFTQEEAVHFFLDRQVMHGVTAATLEGFKPQAGLTRAEAVEMLRNYLPVFHEAKQAEPSMYLDYSPTDSKSLESRGSIHLVTTGYIGQTMEVYIGPNNDFIDVVMDTNDVRLVLPNTAIDENGTISIFSKIVPQDYTALTWASLKNTPPVFNAGQAYEAGRFTINQLQTDNSKAQVAAVSYADYTKAIYMIEIVSNDKSLSVYYELDSDHDQNIYFNKGPGLYIIHPYLVNGSNQVLRGTPFYVTNTDKVDHLYEFPSQFVSSDDPIITELAQSIVAGKVTEWEKLVAIHDWVTHHIAYDTVNYLRDTVTWDDNNSLTVVKNGIAVCSGYAALTAALSRAAGMKAKIVNGVGGADLLANAPKDPIQLIAYANHAWNEIWCNGRWVTVDTTWDAGGLDGSNFVWQYSTKYLDPAPETFSLDHLKSEEF